MGEYDTELLCVWGTVEACTLIGYSPTAVLSSTLSLISLDGGNVIEAICPTCPPLLADMRVRLWSLWQPLSVTSLLPEDTLVSYLICLTYL